MKKEKSRKRRRRSPFGSGSLGSRQLHTFLVSFILPSFVLILFLFGFFLDRNFQYHVQEQQNTLEVLSSHLTAVINSDLQMSLAYIYINDINYFYNFLSRTEMEDDLITYNQLLWPYMKAVSRNITLQNENIRGFGFLPCNHNTECYYYIPRYEELEVRASSPAECFDWYETLCRNDTSVVFVPGTDGEGRSTISIVRAAKNVDMKRTTGYIIVDVSMEFLYSLLDELSISPRSGIVLLSPSGEYLFSTNSEFSGTAGQLQDGAKSLSWQGETYDIESFADTAHGFSLYYLSSRSDLLSGYLGMLLLTLAFYAGMTAIAVGTFHFQSKKIAASVTPILDTMARYNAGDTASRCDTESCSITEFARISEDLNEMIRKINQHIEKEYKLQIEQKVAEYQALQAEVDPHFLYNILNLFISLNRIGAKNELEQAIVSLSHLFRYTCEHTSDSTVCREFEFITDYLFLQKIRFDERLEFQIYAEPELENFRIPKLLIQPLVENAVVHSLEPSDLPVRILIAAVTMRNGNGVWFAVFLVINTGLPYLAGREEGRTGLSNIRRRLGIFHPDTVFSIEGGEGKATKCCIMIPMEAK